MRLRLPRPARRTLLVALGLVLGVAGALLVYTLSIGTLLERVTVPDVMPAAGSRAFIRLVELHTDLRLEPGHHVEIALDGAGTFPPLWRDLREARRTIHLQLYYCQPGALADTLAAVLAARARAGVEVRFLYDGFGCEPLGDGWFDRLRQAGVDARSFRPVRWWSLHKAQERSHARIVVVDGTVGWTGGFGIDDRWSAAGVAGEPGWRETNVRFTGPAVAQLQAAFADGWAETAGELLITPGLYAPVPTAEERDGGSPGAEAAVLHSVPDRGSTTAERFLALSVAGARRTVYIANAYFVPHDDLRAMLIAAAGRGVDVRVLTPNSRTDIPLVRYAGRGRYAELLDGGVRIWEYGPAMMHAKTFVVDGVWTSVGSMNFDTRSLAVNDESTLVVADSALGAAMDDLFLADLRRATEITRVDFARRSRWERVKERFAVALAGIL